MPSLTPINPSQSSNNYGFVQGEVYFRLTWADVKLRYPVIESFVYLGMNFSKDDLTDTWYFQSAIDFASYGNAMESFGRPISCATEGNLQDFVTAEGLKLEIDEAAKRRSTA